MGLKHGQFCWHELMTTDADAAKAFYSETIGWKVKSMDGMPDYNVLFVGEDSVGGIMTMPDEVKAAGVPQHWLGYVGVDDVDATAKQAAELGGKVLKEGFDIPEVGRMAVLADPQGAAIAIFKPAGEMTPHAGDARVGDVTWNELNSTDWENAWTFYEKLFGWTKTQDMDMPDGGGKYQMYKHASSDSEIGVGGMGNMAKAMGFPPSWLYYITVDDIDAAAKRATDKGGKLMNGPMEVPGGDKIAHVTDPQGGMFALHWRNPNATNPAG